MRIAEILLRFLEGELEEGMTYISDEEIIVEVVGERTLRLDGDEEHCTITFPEFLFLHHNPLPNLGFALLFCAALLGEYLLI